MLGERSRLRIAGSNTKTGGKKLKTQIIPIKKHFGGIPTDLDVKRLRDAYPFDEMSVGDIMPYSDIEAMLGIDRRSSRFKSVTLSWRKRAFRETPFTIGTERGLGFKVLSDSETAKLSGDKLGCATRAMRSSVRYAARVDTRNITSEERAVLYFNNDRVSKALLTLQIKSSTALPDIEKDNNGGIK